MFSSTAALAMVEQSPNRDLESSFYMLVYFKKLISSLAKISKFRKAYLFERNIKYA